MNNNLKSNLSIVIPAFNESESLASYLPLLLAYCKERNWKIIIVNDGSTDNSKEILDSHVHEKNYLAIHHKVNKGYGGAIKTGINAATTEFIVTIDGDGQHVLEDIDKLLNVIIDNEADMIVGSRKGLKSASLYRSLGKWLLRRIAKILLPIQIEDLNSGMKLYRTSLVQSYLNLCPDTMAFSDIITLIFISKKHLVLEFPISIKDRETGQSTIRTFTAFETVLEIINIVMLFNPLKIFLPLALLFTGLGLIWTLPIILMGRGVSVGGSLMIMWGIMCFMLGLIAEQLSLIRKNKFQ